MACSRSRDLLTKDSKPVSNMTHQVSHGSLLGMSSPTLYVTPSITHSVTVGMKKSDEQGRMHRSHSSDSTIDARKNRTGNASWKLPEGRTGNMFC